MKKISARDEKVISAKIKRQGIVLRRACTAVGGITKMAVRLSILLKHDISYQSVQHWIKRGIPQDRVVPVEIACGGVVQCEELFEDYAVVTHRPFQRAA